MQITALVHLLCVHERTQRTRGTSGHATDVVEWLQINWLHTSGLRVLEDIKGHRWERTSGVYCPASIGSALIEYGGCTWAHRQCFPVWMFRLLTCIQWHPNSSVLIPMWLYAPRRAANTIHRIDPSCLVQSLCSHHSDSGMNRLHVSSLYLSSHLPLYISKDCN